MVLSIVNIYLKVTILISAIFIDFFLITFYFVQMHVDFVWIIYITPKFQLSIGYFTIIKLFEQKRPYICT